MSELRMDAYYYGFDATGVTAVDEILSTVACAGKAFHSTEDWQDECRAFAPHCVGNSPVDWMQNAGNRAAEYITKMQARIAELEATNGSMQAVLDMFRETGRLPDQRIAELERQVLGLREAMKAHMDAKHGSGAVKLHAHALMLQALTDTEQAGREAEARAVLTFAHEVRLNWPSSFAAMLQSDAEEYATRLRNGGSDGK